MGFADPAALRSAGDKQAHDWITTELAAHRPDDAVLSEEGERHDPRRRDAARVWIVDPLDGTREFGEEGRGDWAVHIALWERGSAAPSQIVAAAIALPAVSLTLSTAYAPPYPERKPGKLRFVASRTRPPALLTAVAEAMDAEIVPMGSAGAKIAAVILGDVDAYVHAGGQWSGTTRHPSVSHSRPDCTPPGSTVRRWNTTGPTRNSPTWWFAGSIGPRRSSPPSHGLGNGERAMRGA